MNITIDIRMPFRFDAPSNTASMQSVGVVRNQRCKAMNHFPVPLNPTQNGDGALTVNRELIAILDVLCQEIELPEGRVSDARSRYETIGGVLIDEGSPLRRFGPRVFAQGSIALGTPIKPLKTHEFDVDLACLFSYRPSSVPDEVRRAVFNRLNNHGRYEGKVKLLARCIQLTYADEFHLDIMPCIPGLEKRVQVPDKRAGEWVASDPEGYARWFETVAQLNPLHVRKAAPAGNRSFSASANAKVDPFPEWDSLQKRPLQRCVQLLKRHRDKMFYDDKSLAPSSVIITTLAGHSYRRAVMQNTYECPLRLLIDVIAGMLDFIDVFQWGGQPAAYTIANPVLPTENFASKWKDERRLPENFYHWHSRVLASVSGLARYAQRGIHELARNLGDDFGQESAAAAVRRFSDGMQRSRLSGGLNIIVPASATIEAIRAVPQHTHFGA